MKYTKKPVTINAVQWIDGKISETPDWIKEALHKDMNKDVGAIMRMGEAIHIATLEGIMIASNGDYIIQGVKGEIYPCKPDIFKLTYNQFSDAPKGAEPDNKGLIETLEKAADVLELKAAEANKENILVPKLRWYAERLSTHQDILNNPHFEIIQVKGDEIKSGDIFWWQADGQWQMVDNDTMLNGVFFKKHENYLIKRSSLSSSKAEVLTDEQIEEEFTPVINGVTDMSRQFNEIMRACQGAAKWARDYINNKNK